MAQSRISGLNYDAILSTEDHKRYRQIIEEEIVTRTKLASGFPYSASTWQSQNFGIVDATDPSKITASEGSRPLFVKANLEAGLAVSVNPGYAVTPNGTILRIETIQKTINLSTSPQAGKSYIIVLQAIIDRSGGTTQLNDYNVSLSSQELVKPEITSIEYTTGWFPNENQVVLGMVRVTEAALTSTLEMTVDLTTNNYSFNRPWFSVVDNFHRNQKGSGTVTERNPHATSINDLTIPGTVGIFQGLSGQGVVVSRDRLRNKMTGALLCVDNIPAADILTDLGGTITAGSIYSKAGARYTYLSKFPVRLGSVHVAVTPAHALAADLIEGTNILVFGPSEVIPTTTVSVQYTAAPALLPPVKQNVSSNFLTFGSPGDDEVVVSGGFTYPAVADPTVSFEGSGPFARNYSVYLLGTGIMAAFPQILMGAQSANLPVTGVSGQPLYPARISVGITNTNFAFNTLSVVVAITGVVHNEIGANSTQSITEVLTFNLANGFNDQQPGTGANYDLPGQILVTQNKFSSISSVSVTPTGAGPNPQIQMWAELEPGYTPEMNDLAPIAQVSWNGTSVQNIRDLRRIQKSWTGERSGLQSTGEAEYDSNRMFHFIKGTQLTALTSRLMTEDFEDLRYHDSVRGFIPPTKAVGAIGLNSAYPLRAGDSIVIAPGKTISAALSTATLLPGQFAAETPLAPLDTSIVRGNIITAINNPLFNSGVIASAHPTSQSIVVLELQSTLGVAANSVTIIQGSVPQSGTAALSLTGYSFANDGYGESFLDRHVLGLKSNQFPATNEAAPYAYQFRRRYRSRALAMTEAVGPKTRFLVQVHGEDKGWPTLVKLRGAKTSSAGVWDAWQIATVVPFGEKGLYSVTFTSAVHKVQVEYYGRARGLSVFAIGGA